jgi:general secretion pathway protein C
MSENSRERADLAQSALVMSVTLAALILFSTVLAYWTWVWLAPRPASRARAVEVQPRVDAAYGLFGGRQGSRNALAPTGLAIKLLGVAAASGGKSGYAVVQLEANKILAAREGTDIAPGIRLAEVQAAQIILERNGVRETLALPDKTGRAREPGPLPQQNTPAQAPARSVKD